MPRTAAAGADGVDRDAGAASVIGCRAIVGRERMVAAMPGGSGTAAGQDPRFTPPGKAC